MHPLYKLLQLVYVKLKRRKKNFVFLATSLTTKYSACVCAYVWVCVSERVCQSELASVRLKCVCSCTVGLSSVNAIIKIGRETWTEKACEETE